MSQWVSSRWRLPQTNTTVIVYGAHYIPGGRMAEAEKIVCEAVYMGKYNRDDTPIFAHGERFMKVDDWMPMPKSPDEIRAAEADLIKRYGIDGPFGPK